MPVLFHWQSGNMRLTHIKLAGFKSFVDPTTLHIPGQLVAVMGPNGCGKSNVIDAVRWVLGEASAKQLRGESMQDVIFNGATTRKAVSRASVELVFDNSDHRLQGAFGQYAEIAIKRVLTRQGQSTYYINNQVVRRRDITDLFLGTGVGARGYAVIEQGMISRIIEARPEELRAHIEEAAGVSKYKERRKETATRLKDTTEHLQRLADIQSELNIQVDKLSIQAQTAARYQDLSADLQRQQNHMDFIRYREAEALWQQANQAQQDLQTQVDVGQEQAQQLSDALHQLQIKEQTSQQHIHSLTEQRAIEREQAARLETQIQHLKTSHERIAKEQAQATEQLQHIDVEKENLLASAEEAHIELEELQLSHEQWQMQLEQLQESQSEQQHASEDLEQAWQHQQTTAHRLERELALLIQQQQHHLKQQQDWQQRQQQLKQQQQALDLPETHHLQDAQERVALLQEQVLEAENLIWQHENEQQTLQDALKQAQQRLQECQQHIIAIEAKQQTIRALLPHVPNHVSDDAQILWQQMQVDETWVHAVQTLLRERQHCRSHAPQNLPDKHSAISWLNIPTDLPNTSMQPDSLAHFIQTNATFAPAIAHWFGKIRCVPDLNTALAQQTQLQADEAFITPEAWWVDAVSVQALAQESEALLEHQAQLHSLETQWQQWRPQTDQAHQVLLQLQHDLHTQQQQLKHAQTQYKQWHEQLRLAHTEVTKLLERTQQGQLRHNQIEQELAQLQTSLDNNKQEHAQRQIQIQDLQDAQKQLNIELAQLSQQRQTQQQHKQQLHLQILEVQRQQGLVALNLQKLQQQNQHIQQRLQQLTQQQQHWSERQQNLALQFDDDANTDVLQNQWQACLLQIETLDEHILNEQQHKQQHVSTQQQLQQQQQQLDTQLPQQRAQLQQQLLLQQQAQLNQERYLEQLQQRGAMLKDLLDLPVVGLAPLQQAIVRLNQQLQALGPVNLAALQELEQAQERCDYYQNQRNDVEQAMALLNDAMAQIDAETKNLFEQTFHAVNEHMQAFFPTLFGGGQASLNLVGDDMLEAGVAIMAQPPGKKNSTIHLLSGGEKALTAMSLVFALFSLNPAPFCLLDEVDAPLDDANTARFCRLVEKMSQQTQFLYISHNRLTMEMAEQLIGVTMQEKGVSRIVDVDIKQAMALTEQVI